MSGEATSIDNSNSKSNYYSVASKTLVAVPADLDPPRIRPPDSNPLPHLYPLPRIWTSTKLSESIIHNFPEESDYNLRSCAC